LLHAAADLRPPLRTATYTTVFGLLTATGMRVGKALRLKTGDINPADGVLTVAEAKLDRPRMIPLHPTTNAALASYVDLRRGIYPKAAAFFVSTVGTPLAYSTLRQTFNELSTSTGLRTPTRRPHMHDLRHRFAVRVLGLGGCRGERRPVPSAPGPRTDTSRCRPGRRCPR
jgi:integrase